MSFMNWKLLQISALRTFPSQILLDSSKLSWECDAARPDPKQRSYLFLLDVDAGQRSVCQALASSATFVC